jgi:hypothetical protein
MEITNDLNRWSDILNDHWLGSEDLSSLDSQLDDVLSLTRELLAWLDVLALLWLQQWFHEHLHKGVVRVLFDLGLVLLLRVQLFWFFGEFVDRNLSDNETEVLCLWFTDLVLLVGRSGDVSLVREFELSLHVV